MSRIRSEFQFSNALPRFFYEGQPVLAASWQSAFNTISSVGQFFGGFMCSYFADRFGRRAALLVGIILVASGIFGEVFATANGAFLVGKMVLGFGLGFYLTVGPMYCSEVSFSSLTLEMSTNKARCLLSDFVVSQRLVSISAL
jgi:MFS family permease